VALPEVTTSGQESMDEATAPEEKANHLRQAPAPGEARWASSSMGCTNYEWIRFMIAWMIGSWRGRNKDAAIRLGPLTGHALTDAVLGRQLSKAAALVEMRTAQAFPTDRCQAGIGVRMQGV